MVRLDKTKRRHERLAREVLRELGGRSCTKIQRDCWPLMQEEQRLNHGECGKSLRRWTR